MVDLGITLLVIIVILATFGAVFALICYESERNERQAKIDAYRLLYVLRSCARQKD